MLHAVDGVIEVEVEFGDNTQLVALERAEFSAELAGVLLYCLDGVSHLVLREDGEIDVGYRQVGGDAHFAHGDERSGECACKAEEDVAEVFLYETGDLVLSGGLHRNDVFYRWVGREQAGRESLAGEDACAPGHFLMVRPGDRTSSKVVGCITKKPTHGSSSARNASQQPEAV